MDESIDDEISINIGKKLDAHAARSSDCCIFRVPRHLRNVNKEAYEPLMVAIGPYHHRRYRHDNHLMGMEEHKLRCLKMLLRRTGEENLKRYVQAMRSMEGRARSFYAEDLSDLPTDEFVEMMLLDSCFIFEVISHFIVKVLTNNNDPIFEPSRTDHAGVRDLLLVENQLPLFVLLGFLNMTNTPNEQILLDIRFLLLFMLPEGVEILNMQALDDRESIEKSGHLLGLLHTVCQPPSREIEKKWEFIPSATRLKEAGIKLRKAKKPLSLFDIKFENGVLKIPTLTIDDHTERFFRNLIAYEEFFRSENSYFADYIRFIDCLVNSREDVELLCDRGIINNWLGDETVVAGMLNKLRDSIFWSQEDFYYSKLFNQVNMHSHRRRNIWMAKCDKWMADLRDKYFNSPWAFISLLAAIFLIVLTAVQTHFSVLAYYKH